LRSSSAKPINYYRAAWNADAIWRWESCSSVCFFPVRLSVCQTRDKTE